MAVKLQSVSCEKKTISRPKERPEEQILGLTDRVKLKIDLGFDLIEKNELINPRSQLKIILKYM